MAPWQTDRVSDPGKGEVGLGWVGLGWVGLGWVGLDSPDLKNATDPSR